MGNQFIRNEYIIGSDTQKKIFNTKVVVVGVGGVGSHSAESLARLGIGEIILIDSDVFETSNLNRQLPATHNTIGEAKVEVMKNRILEINPKCRVKAIKTFIDINNLNLIYDEKPDYLVDAIDNLNSKYDLIKMCLEKNIKFISSMGTGNKLDPTKFRITDITKTSYDPIARILRTRLRKERIKGKVPVIWSDELPIKSKYTFSSDEKKVPGSISFVPSVSGYIATSYILRKILETS